MDNIFSAFKDLTTLTTAFKNNADCVNFLKRYKYKNGIVFCPDCGCYHCYSLNNGLYKCSKCGTKFSILKGTIFECTKLSLFKWFLAMYHFTNSSVTISSYQLATTIGVTQKTAWNVLQKIRELCKSNAKMGNSFICPDDAADLVYNKAMDKYICPKCGRQYVIIHGKVFEDNNFANTQTKYLKVFEALTTKTGIHQIDINSAEYRDVTASIKSMDKKAINAADIHCKSYILMDTCWIGGRMYWKHEAEKQAIKMKYEKLKKEKRRIANINRYNKVHQAHPEVVDIDDKFLYMTVDKLAVACMYDVEKDIIRFICINGDSNSIAYHCITDFTNGFINLITDDGSSYNFADSYCNQHLTNCHSRSIYTAMDKEGNVYSSNRVEGAFHMLKTMVRNLGRMKIKHIERYLNEKAFKYNNRSKKKNHLKDNVLSMENLFANINTTIRIKEITDENCVAFQ